MTVEVVVNPVDDSEITLVKGSVEGVYFNPLKEVKTYTGGASGNWTPTHSINLVVDGARVNLGLTDRDTLRCKDKAGEYQDVIRGAKVSIIIEDVSEYNGKPQYSSRSSRVTVLQTGTPQQNSGSNRQSGETMGGKRDYTGVEVGHAINCALELISHQEFDSKELIELSNSVHDITKSLKEKQKANHPQASDYDIGASVGQAVLNACKTYDSVEGIEDYALKLLAEVVPSVEAHIKGEEEEAPAPKPKAKPKAPKKATTKKAPEPEPEEEEFEEEEWEDDIPF